MPVSIKIRSKRKNVSFINYLYSRYNKIPTILQFLVIPSLIALISAAEKWNTGNLSASSVIALLIITALSIVQSFITFIEKKGATRASSFSEWPLFAIEAANNLTLRKIAKLKSAIEHSNNSDEKAIRLARSKLTFDRSMTEIAEVLHDNILDFIRRDPMNARVNIVLNIMRPSGHGTFEVLHCIARAGSAGRIYDRTKRLTESNNPPTLAGHVWIGGKIKSTSSVAKSLDRNEFTYLTDDEENHIKSLVCYRVDDLQDNKLFIVCIDADKENVFPDDDDKAAIKNINGYLKAFEVRIVYEYYFKILSESFARLIDVARPSGEKQ